MHTHTFKHASPLILIVLVLGLASLACLGAADLTVQPTSTPRLVPNEIKEQTRMPDLENEAGHPELVLTFKEQAYGDLPVYRATLSSPLIVNTDGASPWGVEMVTSRRDDLQKLGGLQPGTVIQDAAFMGSYDPKAGTLSGSLTHTYSAHQLATPDYLESQQTSDLTCELDLIRAAAGETMQGVCTGLVSVEMVVPSDSSLNRTESKKVTLLVSSQIPPELLNRP